MNHKVRIGKSADVDYQFVMSSLSAENRLAGGNYQDLNDGNGNSAGFGVQPQLTPGKP